MSYEKSIYKLLPDVRDLITNGKESVDSKNLQKFVDTLKEEALKSGLIDESDYDKIVDPKKMINPN